MNDIMNIMGIIGTVVGIAGLIIGIMSYRLTIKTFKLAGSIDDAVRAVKLSTKMNENKKKLLRLIKTALDDMQEGKPEWINRIAISHFREVLIELERYKTLFQENDKAIINNATLIVENLSKKETYNINDCTDFETQAQKINALINGVIL